MLYIAYLLRYKLFIKIISKIFYNLTENIIDLF